MKRLLLFLALLGTGCVTSATSVQRAMLAPLPPAPMLSFERERGGEVGIETQVRPGTIAQPMSTSGIGVPRLQVRGGPMVRVSKNFAFGGAFEVVSGEGAQFQNAESQTIASRRPALGVVLGGHFTAFEVGVFGLDGSAQVSLHGLPVDISLAPGPLSKTPGATVATESTVIPGLAVTLLPRFTTQVGTFFAGVQAHTNADIEARGVRLNTSGGSTTDDLGSTREILGQVGVGYAFSFNSLFGVVAQAWLPFSSARFGYVPWVGLNLHFGLGQPLKERPPPPAPPQPLDEPPPLDTTPLPPPIPVL